MTLPAMARRGRLLVAAVGTVILLAVVGAVALPSLGTAGPWVDAWAESPTSTTLMVRAVGQDRPAGACGPPQVHLAVAETPTTVEVTARYSRVLPGSSACTAVGYGPVPHAVALREPLGRRSIVDAATGEERPLLLASTAARISGLPSGFATTDLARSTVGGAEMIQRTWRGPGGFVLLTTQTSTSRRLLHHREVVRFDGRDVRFHVHEDEPRDVYYLEWRMPSGTQANIDLHLPHGTWTPQQALSVVRRTTEGTPS